MSCWSVLSAGSWGSGERRWWSGDTSTCEQRLNLWPQTSCWAPSSCRVSICPVFWVLSQLSNNVLVRSVCFHTSQQESVVLLCEWLPFLLTHLSTFSLILISVFTLSVSLFCHGFLSQHARPGNSLPSPVCWRCGTIQYNRVNTSRILLYYRWRFYFSSCLDLFLS